MKHWPIATECEFIVVNGKLRLLNFTR